MLLLNSLRGMLGRVTARRSASGRSPNRSYLKRRLVIEELESRQLLSAPPNFVFIITDDQDAETVAFMPRLQSLLADQGTTFSNMFVTTSLCCPSQVSILTGQYAHNHGVLTNALPNGGFQRFQQLNGDQSTLATWLHDAGYLTGRVGKYLVGYPTGSTYVPPGWDEWRSTYDGFSTYFNYTMNENGTVVSYGNQPDDYLTDVLAGKAVGFLDRAETNDDQPFFLFFSPNAPHSGVSGNGPPTPAPRHAGLFPGVQAPRPPSFNEANVSDKPPAISSMPLLTGPQIAAIDSEYRSRLQSLQAVDEAIEQIVTALAERGELENTYLIFTSDNGYFLGEHRLRNGKGQIYEEAIRVPLVVRGPGVPQGATSEHMVLNIDFAPTIAMLSGAQPSRVMDGRSLVPLLQQSPPPPEQWRQDFLVELTQPNIRALRTRDEVYVEYASGPRELYDLVNDPYQLTSLHAVADPARLQALSARLAELAASSGDDSRRDPPPAQVAGVVVNDGSDQRSRVSSLTVTFSGIVSLGAGAFEVRREGGDLVGLSIAASVVEGRTVATLTFTGPDVVAGSLADGDYTLTVRAASAHDLLGHELDGDGDGFVGGNRTDAFFRRYGDVNGDRQVVADVVIDTSPGSVGVQYGNDFGVLINALNSRRGDPHYVDFLDFNGDGVIDTADLASYMIDVVRAVIVP